MRFAWYRKKLADSAPIKESRTNRIIFAIFNIFWWAPVVPAFAGIIDYRTGFIGFAVISFVRLAANLYRNNILKGEQAEYFPLRGL